MEVQKQATTVKIEAQAIQQKMVVPVEQKLVGNEQKPIFIANDFEDSVDKDFAKLISKKSD